MDGQEARDAVDGEFGSEDGDYGLRSSLNLMGLSTSSHHSDLHLLGTDCQRSSGNEDSGGESQEEDRDSQGRLRFSMSMSNLSDGNEHDEEGHSSALEDTAGSESERFDEHRDDERGSQCEDGGDDEEFNGDDPEHAAKGSTLGTFGICRDDLVTGVSTEPFEPKDTQKGEFPRQSSQTAHADEMNAIEQRILMSERSDSVNIVGEPSQEAEIPVGATQSHALESESERNDVVEGNVDRHDQVKPALKTSSPATPEEERRAAQELAIKSEDTREEAPVQPVHRSFSTQVEAEHVSSASLQCPPASAAVVDCTDSVIVLPLPPEPHPAPSYKVRDLFPVVYEKSTDVNKIKQKSLMAASTAAANNEERHLPSHPATSTSSGLKRTNSATKEQAVRQASQQRIQSLSKQLEVTQIQLKSVTQSIKMHQIADAEKKKLQQRNARIKQQLDALTADLQRTKAESARLQAENELFAAKLPHLQAELLRESCQADEKQAQAVQLQLMITQLKARVHVLQTRNGNLETQYEKAQLELRECRKELRCKASTMLATSEKLTKLEAETSNLKNVHAQELLHWKTRFSTATQRFELDKTKRANEFGRKTEYQLNEKKLQAATVIKRKRELEVLVAKLEGELNQSKCDVDTGKLDLHKKVKETLTLENLLKKAHRVEATLRNEVAVLKTKLRVSGEEQKKQGVQEARKRIPGGGAIPRTCNLSRSHGDKLLYPLDLLLLELGVDSDDDDGEASCDAEERELVGRHCECCALLRSATSSPRQQDDVNSKYSLPTSLRQQREGERGALPCQECALLREQLEHTNAEIHRLRLLHSEELKVQASTYNYLLRLGSSRGAGGSNDSRTTSGTKEGASLSA